MLVGSQTSLFPHEEDERASGSQLNLALPRRESVPYVQDQPDAVGLPVQYGRRSLRPTKYMNRQQHVHVYSIRRHELRSIIPLQSKV